MAEKPNIKKQITPGQCAAMRCKNEPDGFVSGELWDLPGYRIPLCGAHMAACGDDATAAGVSAAIGASVIMSRKEESEADDAEAKALAQATLVEADEALEMVGQLDITSQEELEFVSELLLDVKGKLNALLKAEGAITGPISDLLKQSRELFKPAKLRLAQLEAALKQKIGAAALTEQSDNQQALEKVAEGTAEGDDDKVQKALQSVRHEGNVTGVSTRMLWDYKVVDFDKVPREFLNIDKSAVKIHMREKRNEEGVPEPVEGLEFYQKPSVRAQAQA